MNKEALKVAGVVLAAFVIFGVLVFWAMQADLSRPCGEFTKLRYDDGSVPGRCYKELQP